MRWILPGARPRQLVIHTDGDTILGPRSNRVAFTERLGIRCGTGVAAADQDHFARSGRPVAQTKDRGVLPGYRVVAANGCGISATANDVLPPNRRALISGVNAARGSDGYTVDGSSPRTLANRNAIPTDRAAAIAESCGSRSGRLGGYPRRQGIRPGGTGVRSQCCRSRDIRRGILT